ncbi:LOW QUALITY PROTEIN: reverse transcriptase [Phytophthora megakarya]|uniref:Reverse transcriptase n=1 Tax=Phytophthora megakarya TaxID=4795 RepID=A0A225UWP5_9STRA|nr:LOW QUALITY PROTEIN: reverse transcriptase [Phytophthora megakarya]
MARRLVDPLAKVTFVMSCLGGRARSWAYGRRLTDPTCFSTYESFKEELKLAFEPPQNDFRLGAEFLDLQHGKHDVHAYAQRARYLVSNVVTDPMDEARAAVSGRSAWSARAVTIQESLTVKECLVPDQTLPRNSPPRRGDNSVSTPGVDTRSISESRKFSVVRRRCDNDVSALGVATHCSAVRRRGDVNASTPGVDATSCVDGCKRPALKLACCRAAGLYEAGRDQARLDDPCPRVQEPAGGIKEYSSMAGPGRNAREYGIHKTKRRRKHKTLRKSRSGTETLQRMSAGPTQEPTYRKMEWANPPTDTSESTSLPVMGWKRFAKDLYDGRIEQLCILSDRERMTSKAEELGQLFAGSATESEDTLNEEGTLRGADLLRDSARAQRWLPDEIAAELPQDKGIQHEIDLVPGTKYCVTRQPPLPREQVKAIDDFFERRRKAGQVRESKSPHSAPTFCVKKPQGGWRWLAHRSCTPIPQKDVIIDSMSKSTIYSVYGALDLRDGFCQILMRESNIPLTAVSTTSGVLWEWLVMLQGQKNAPATFNGCVTHLLRLMRDFAPSYFDDVRSVKEKTDVDMHKEHLRELLGLMRKHKLYANLKKSIFGASEIPVLRCLVGKNGVRPDPEKVRVINEWPTPSNMKELRQFLGLATYLCKYVDNHAGKIRPLSQLLKKEAAWEWTAECQQAFDAVKLGLTEAPILAVADQDRPFHVVCDASDFAIGCALMQLDHEGRDRAVYYQSHERNYPVHDKELLAMKYALAKFRVYLLGNTPFMVYTTTRRYGRLCSLRTSRNE